MKIKIPTGWRKLRKGTIIKPGDKYLSFHREWEISASVGCETGVSFFANSPPLTYIRRIKRRKK